MALQLLNYSNLRFLKGFTPTLEDKLCYIPEQITVTNTAILSLTVRADNSPDGIIISGNIETEISSVISNNLYVYNAILNLAELNLVPGNKITATFGVVVVNITIQAQEPEVTQIAFLNEWNEYEYFETTGILTKTPNATQTTTVIASNGTLHEKIVSIELGEEYKLSTGYIHTQAEVDWLTKILNAQRLFILIAAEWVEVILTTKKLESYKTRTYLPIYALTFKKAIV